MNDGQILLRSILDNPDDTALRLVYSDWLDENGDPQRAEFIRLQCEIYAYDLLPEGSAICTTRQVNHLRRKCQQLLSQHWHWWCPPKTFGRIVGKVRFYGTHTGCQVVQPCDGIPTIFNFVRGFVQSMTTSWVVWSEFGPELLRYEPVVRIDFIDLKPFPAEPSRLLNPGGPKPGSTFDWYRTADYRWGLGYLPCSMWDRMTGYSLKSLGSLRYPTHEEAIQALSRAAIELVRNTKPQFTNRSPHERWRSLTEVNPG